MSTLPKTSFVKPVQGTNSAAKTSTVSARAVWKKMRGKLFDLGGGSAMPLYGQNVRGFTTLKLAKVVQLMKDWRILCAALQETWRVTKDGVEIEETPDWYLTIHHGEAN